MKRICLLGAAIAGLFIIGATNAMALGSHASARTAATKSTSKAKSKVATLKVGCSLSLSLLAPSGSSDVTPASPTGNHAGMAKCPAKGVGKGSEWDSFTTDDSGDMVGKWQEWFNTGTLYGTYLLTPSDSQPSDPSNFAAAAYTGTLVVKGGTGTLAKDYTKRNAAGTMKCSTQDSVHYTCKQFAKLVVPTASK